MRAIGRDGQWHEWGELTDEERREWMEAMNAADRHVETRKRGEFAPALAQNLARYEQKRRFLY